MKEQALKMGFEFRFVQKDNKGNIKNDSGWLENHLTDDGFEEIYEIFFRGDAGPDGGFEIGLNQQSLTQSSSFADLVEVTGDGYSREAVTRDDTASGFPSLGLNADNDMEIESTTVTFENTGTANWDAAVDAFLNSADSTDGEILIAYRPLSADRTLQPGETIDVAIRITGKQPA